MVAGCSPFTSWTHWCSSCSSAEEHTQTIVANVANPFDEEAQLPLVDLMPTLLGETRRPDGAIPSASLGKSRPHWALQNLVGADAYEALQPQLTKVGTEAFEQSCTGAVQPIAETLAAAQLDFDERFTDALAEAPADAVPEEACTNFCDEDSCSEFTAIIVKENSLLSTQLGIILKPLPSGVACKVTKIKTGGLVEKYNRHVCSAVQVKLDDILVAVNDVHGNAASILREADSSNTLHMRFERPILFSVVLTKAAHAPIGLELERFTPCSLMIKKVPPGPMQEWNEMNKDRKVQCGDRVVGVNGRTLKEISVETALRNLRNSSKSIIHIARPCLAGGSIICKAMPV